MKWFNRSVFSRKEGLPNYRVGPKFDNSGAAILTMEKEFTDPVQVYIGAGNLTGAIRPLQPQQVYVNFSNVIAGIGIQHGQMFTLPLSNNNPT